ncbi:MAG: glycosyltransferase family 2 protein [Anaerolineae bacterium]|nr:glycosyltransferase family 2 protein [Anaerolineae bacterium]
MQTGSVVIPCYNSEGSLEPLLHQLAAVLPSLFEHYEVLLVNDASRDRSWEVICQLAETYDWVRGIQLMRNYGQHNALLCGIRSARYDIIVTMDDDLQHPPQEIAPLLEKLNEGYDVVYGTPEHEQHGYLRDMASQITKLVLQNAMGAETARRVSAFRLFRTQVRQAFATYQGPFVSIDVLLTWGTTRFAAIPVRHEPRTIGVSNYTFRKLVTHALNMMTGFSVLPLQLASLTGLAMAIFSIIVLIYVVGRYLLEGTPVEGFPFLASIIGIFSGAQLLALGIIGEYLARMHFRMMDKPSYVVREEVGEKEQETS